MSTFLLTVVVFGLAVAGLALGVIARRQPLAGSCGGAACGTCKRACDHRRDDSL